MCDPGFDGRGAIGPAARRPTLPPTAASQDEFNPATNSITLSVDPESISTISGRPVQVGSVIDKCHSELRGGIRRIMCGRDREDQPMELDRVEARLRKLDQATLEKLVQRTMADTDPVLAHQLEERLRQGDASAFHELAEKLRDKVEHGKIEDSLGVAKALSEDKYLQTECPDLLAELGEFVEKTEAIIACIVQSLKDRGDQLAVSVSTIPPELLATVTDLTLPQEEITIAHLFSKPLAKELAQSLVEMFEKIIEPEEREEELERAIKASEDREYTVSQKIKDLIASKSELNAADILGLLVEQSRLEEGIRVLEGRLRSL